MIENKENHYEKFDEDKMMADNNSAVLYERSRIKALSEQRDDVQKKTFTNWINSHLKKSKDAMKVEDLYADLQDGRILLKLLEAISGEKLPKPTKGKMRIHCMENIGKSLHFLDEQHVYLENLGAHDIVDGNQTLTLGLIWTLILRFQIQYATPDEFDGTRTSKEALLLWCQMKTAGYKNVSIRNFTNSWKDGLAFNAILHKHDPDVVDFVTMIKANPVENMNIAFEIAEREYGVPKLLDAKDIAVDQPDERSVMTYIGVLSNTLNKLKNNSVKCKRLGNVINEAISVDKMIRDYEDGCTDLLDWIISRIDWMDNKKMGKSLPEVKDQLVEFKDYRLEEKPSKFIDRGTLEMNFFEIQSKIRNDNRKLYVPPEGKLISEVNKAWEDLESAEHRIELRLYDELIKQQKLDQLANRFNRKAHMRETWLQENDRLVHQNIFGDNLVTVDAAIKKHEALEGDIYAHEGRINALGMIVDDLDSEDYYKVDSIKKRYNKIVDLWEKLLEDLKSRREKLDRSRGIQVVLQESDYLLDWINELVSRLQTKDFGKHLLGVENLLEKHRILSSDIRNLDHRISEVRSKISTCDFDKDCIDPAIVEKRDLLLQDAYEDLVKMSVKREEELMKYKTVWDILEELDNDKEWTKEISQLMQSPDIGHDLKSVERLIRKDEQINSDVRLRKENIDKKLDDAECQREKDDCKDRQKLIKNQTKDVEDLLENLDQLSKERKDKLYESLKFYQLLGDIDDCDTMILEQRRLFESTEVGDKLSLTELYLKQFEEKMVEVDRLEDNMKELFQRKDAIDKDSLTRKQEGEMNDSCHKLHDDFEELIQLIHNRKFILDNSLTKFHLIRDIDMIDSWIVAKEKFLHTLVPTEEIDELNVIKHRFDGFIDQMKNHSEKLSEINHDSLSLIDSQHPETEMIRVNQNKLNANWNNIADLAAGKQKELDQSLAYNQFLIECKETCSWIKDKMKLLEWTDDLKDDLDGIMQLQRRLGSLQRDVQAVEAKVIYLNKETVQLKVAKPHEEENIETEITNVNELWEELKIMLQDRDARLNSSNELQKFLQDLDAFNVWLSNKQKEVASQDIPNNLQEAEKLQSLHVQVKDEIHCWEPEFTRLLKFGRTLSQSKDDPQYVMFNQRLNGLEDGWEMLAKMCTDKDINLEQSIEAHTFIRDSLQVDSTLTKQETFLSKDDIPITIENTEIALREFDTFKTSVTSNQPKIDSVLSFGESLINNNALSDKIRLKCDQIKERCATITAKINKREHVLRDELKLKMYFEDVTDLEEWIAEKMLIATDTSFRDAKDISTRYNRFKDFERELEASKDKVDDVIKVGEDLIEENPHLQWEIEPKIEALNNQWSDLMTTAKDKSTSMEDANREIIFEETTKSMMSWVTEISSQIITTEEITEEIGLVEINEKMKDQEDKDKQLDVKRKMLKDIADHAEKLKEQYPDREEEFEQIQQEVVVRLFQVEAPMAERREMLSQHKKVRQFFRDIQDEREWIEDKSNIINNSKVIPDSFQVCLQKIRRLKTLATEIDNHCPRIDDVKKDGYGMIEDGHPNSDKFEVELKDLDEKWDDLIDSLHQCEDFFEENKKVRQYVSDADESGDWMSEREFDLLKEEKSKDEEGAINAMRRHDELTHVIQNYASTIGSLSERSKDISNDRLPGWNDVVLKQDKVDKTYASLVEMCLDRRMKIEDLIKLQHLFRSIQDLEEWIAERTVVASSHEVGSEYDHCNLLRDRFAEFAIETNEMGGHRVVEAMDMCDHLIEQGHQEAAEIAQWKDRVNEAWADLLELIETRIQLLKAVWDFFKFMKDSAELIDRVREKVLLIPDVIGKDAKTVASYQRKHVAFVLEINSLKPHVDIAIETATHLLTFYCGDKEHELIERRNQLQKLWYTLNMESDNRNNILMDANDYYRFMSMARELLHWITEIEQQVHLNDKPRDVCGVQLIIGNHRSLKAEIDSRDESRSICITLGRSLINRQHARKDDIRRKCAEIISKHFNIKEDWLERQKYLEMILEVYQFARDAAVAESWLMAQEHNVHTADVGDSLPETLNLIQKHQCLERTLLTQEDKFDALKRLTVFEESELSMTEAMKADNEREKASRLEELIREFRTPLPTPALSRKSSHADVEQEEIIAQVVTSVEQVAPRDIDTTKRAEVSKSDPREFPKLSPPQPKSGSVIRKHEWENSTKKAGNRAWHSLFIELRDKQLFFYKDEKHCSGDKSNTYKNEKPMDLEDAVASVAMSYRKRSHVLRLRLKTGAEYLIQASDDEEMNKWVTVINETSGVDLTKLTSTLPAQKSDFDQETSAQGSKKKFTTLSRKQK